MNNKKICWLTPDCFADCDIDIVPALCKQGWNIHWIILFNLNDNRFSEADFDAIVKECEGHLSMEYVRLTYRKRYPQNAIVYWNLANKVRRQNADVNYINMAPGTPWELAFFYHLPKSNTIITAHQGRVHEGMGHFRYYNFLRDRVYGRLKNVNMFSKSQAAYFKQRYKESKIYQFVLGLKYFGEPTITRQEDGIIRFLSFGSINYAKHIDLLLDAASNLYEQGYKNIRVKIAGKCGDWQTTYKPHIKYPEIIEEEIRMVDNNEIPNLFTDADFFVQPYRVISQSGPFKIAMQYNLPLITSDLPGFTDEMVEGVTGYTFKTNDVKSLEEVMIRAIRMKEECVPYTELKAKMKAHVDTTYAPEALVKQYADMFNDIAKKHESNN